MKYVSRQGFSLIEVMVSMGLLALFSLSLAMFSFSSRQQSSSFGNRTECESFTDNALKNIQASDNALYIRNMQFQSYKELTPTTATDLSQGGTDTKDLLCNATDARKALCDTTAYLKLTNDNFVEWFNNRFSVALYQNIRNTETWAKNLYNRCGGGLAGCPLSGGDIRTGLTFKRVDGNINVFGDIMPTRMTVPPTITEATLRIFAEPGRRRNGRRSNSPPTTIDGRYSGLISVQVFAKTDKVECASEELDLDISLDMKPPTFAQHWPRTYRRAATTDKLWKNPKPNLMGSLAASTANPPSVLGNINNFVTPETSGAIRLTASSIDPNAATPECLCSMGEYLRNGKSCPHWTRSVMIRSNVSEPGSAILCQRNQTGQANDRDAAAPGAGNDPDLTRFRYCAIGLANKDGTQNLTSTLYYPRKSFPPASPSATLPPVTGSLAGSFNPPCSIPFDDPSLQDGTGVCKEIFYNKPALIDLTWNDLPDGDYELRTIAMDASGNVSNDYFVHRFKVAVPNPNWESCPHSSTLCPGQTTVRPNPNDTACGYNFTCDGTKPCCPPPELRCPAGSPCYASNSCPGGAYDGTPQCPGCTGTCPTSSGTRAGQGCPDRNTYSACQVKLDDCGNACPAGLMDPNSICPANNCGALNACGAACPITGTACGCPPAGTLCTNQTKVKDARGINCPGTLPAPGCPAPKAGEVACGTVAMSCDPTDPGAIANSCTKWCTVAPPTPTPTPTPAPTCVREEVWKHSPNGGFEGGDVTNSGCPAPESYGTGPERAPAGPWEFPDHTNFEFYVDAWCAYGDCELSFNGSTLCTHNGPAFGSRNSFNPNLWGQDVSTWGRSGPSPNNGMCDTWCRINVGLMADRCTGGGGGGATPPPTAPPTCNGTCDINIQNQTCTGRMASDSCGNPVCPGNRICSCTPTCTGSRSSQYCSGVPTGESDGCGGTCRGDYDCAGCSCDPAVAANTCVGTPIANRCGRMGPPTNCQGTKQPGCENGVPVCGGTCAAPPTPSCQNECVNSWDCGSAPMCDPYSECSIDRYACVTQPSGCNQCVWQQFCPTCRPYDNYGCFTAGALIDTPRGAIPIEQIKIGDEVYSYDNLLKTRVRGRVERVFTHDVEIFGIVELEDGTKFEVTAEHKFYLPELELYEAAGKLKPGDKLLRDNGAGELYVEVKSVDFSNAERRAKVYNFHVPYFQNYYVNGVLVHNIKMRDVDYQYY